MKVEITLRRFSKSYNRTYSTIHIADEAGNTLFVGETEELKHDPALDPTVLPTKRCLPAGSYRCLVTEGETTMCALRISDKMGWRIEPRTDRAVKPKWVTVVLTDDDPRDFRQMVEQWNDAMLLIYTADSVVLTVDDGVLRET